MPNILLGVCGGIAAYKSAELLRALQREGMNVRVIMTRSAEQFITPLTFASLSNHRVYTSLWDDSESASEIEHIAQAQWADLLLIAPATANTIARLAHGLADDFLTCTYLATQAPVLLAPAMNVNMLTHPATQANIATLQQRGHIFIDSGSGYLACGMTGGGRLAEIETIVAAVQQSLHKQKDLQGETILITAGGTREAIDPVRFLGNRSSGKMGYALAATAQQRSARVLLITAPTALPAPAGVEVIAVTSAADMHAAVLHHLPHATTVIMAAAVADFRPVQVATSKLERSGNLTLQLEATEDITQSIATHRKPGTRILAFAAETGLNIERARAKLQRKGADAIVLNDISRDDLGFDSDRNAAIFLTRDTAIELPEATKTELAQRILDQMQSIHTQQAITR